MDKEWLAQWSKSQREKLQYNGKPMSQRKFADFIGVSHKAIQSWERRQVDYVSEESVAAIAKQEGVDPRMIREKLYGESELDTFPIHEKILEAIDQLNSRVLKLEGDDSPTSQPMSAAAIAMQDALVAAGYDWRYEGVIEDLYNLLNSKLNGSDSSDSGEEITPDIGIDVERLRTLLFGFDEIKDKEVPVMAALMRYATGNSEWSTKYLIKLLGTDTPRSPRKNGKPKS